MCFYVLRVKLTALGMFVDSTVAFNWMQGNILPINAIVQKYKLKTSQTDCNSLIAQQWRRSLKEVKSFEINKNTTKLVA